MGQFLFKCFIWMSSSLWNRDCYLEIIDEKIELYLSLQVVGPALKPKQSAPENVFSIAMYSGILLRENNYYGRRILGSDSVWTDNSVFSPARKNVIPARYVMRYKRCWPEIRLQLCDTGEPVNLSEPRFSHLQKGNNEGCYIFYVSFCAFLTTILLYILMIICWSSAAFTIG